MKDYFGKENWPKIQQIMEGSWHQATPGSRKQDQAFSGGGNLLFLRTEAEHEKNSQSSQIAKLKNHRDTSHVHCVGEGGGERE